MFTITIKGLWARKRRLLGTGFAVFLGVAFLMGTLTLGNTLQRNFTNLFADANAGTDAVVQSTTNLAARMPALIPASVLPTVRGVAGVADAQPVVDGTGLLEGKDGKVIGGIGAPREAGNWITDPTLNPYRLVAGRAPRTDSEVVINQGAAGTGNLAIGDSTIVQVPSPVRVTIVGIATFGSASGFGTASYVGFTLDGAVHYLRTPSSAGLSSISVRGASGVDQTALVSRVSAVLPSGVEAITGKQLSAQNVSSVDSDFLNGLRGFLLAFAFIALLVATFSINNTLSILVAQRSRESALLRAVGATRRQTLVAVLIESLGIGVVASVVGILGGVGIAELLKGLFDSFGFALPAGGLVLSPSAVLIAAGVGLGVTVLAAVAPAVRASRVRPVAALRASSVEASGTSWVRLVVGVVLALGGAALVVTAGSGLGQGALGAMLMIAGVVTLGPLVASPIAGVLGRMGRSTSASLARRNAQRNPRRTAATAAPLLVGVAVVTLFTAFAGSIGNSLRHGVSQDLRADVVITTPGYGGQVSPSVVSAVRSSGDATAVSGLGKGQAVIGTHKAAIATLDSDAIGPLVALPSSVGAALSHNQLAVDTKTATNDGWSVGSAEPVTYPDGTTGMITVGAVYPASPLVGSYLLPSGLWNAHSPQAVDQAVLIKLRTGATIADISALAVGFGAPTVQTRSAYVSASDGPVKTMLGLVYAMLALAVIIALLGIANTLSLSAHERSRETGLLRAVGQTRLQLRRMIRWESVTVSLFGAVGGMALGAFLGWALVRIASKGTGFIGVVSSFSLPITQLVVILVAGALVGVLAAIRPARRAAEADILAAISVS